MLYLIGLALLLMAILLFIIAPRNLWDTIIMMAAVVVLVIAILTDGRVAQVSMIRHLLLALRLMAQYVAPIFALVVGLVAWLHSFRLYSQEKNKLQFSLGLGLATVLIFSALYQYLLIYFFPNRLASTFLGISQFIMMYYLLLFINYLVVTLRLNILADEGRQDYLIVLGLRLLTDGQLSSSLIKRLNMVKQYVDHQYFLYGQAPIVITSGWSYDGQQITEAQAMKDYLVARGLDSQGIWLEDQAKNTHENFTLSKRLIMTHDKRPLDSIKGVFVTSSYHLYRGQLYANMVGMYHFSGIGAPSLLLDGLLAGMREYVAILFMHRKLHMVMTLVMAGLAIITYHHFV
ncbi:hypothetical protein AWM75_03995 [Aerococcus urinaehominis]|uniref:DUF218 domain-containing protein n=1 Tax=Aerococcus urinaehominis TaxID=128944 RepID=A0A120IAU6_9LACT|nr:YdcF family protein [Aerococcus urinaehominis]AMB99218.1 hypothetical protein AWM75_03995 [Aerococcus urinaehominis]SDM32036.1 Uncharacterized SAM-binding protein YcdF, DUF218 family [Aerococcus urinaehominis]